MTAADIRIQDIRQTDDRTLAIHWTDGKEDQLDVVFLRRECPCAACVDEWTKERTLKPSSVSESVRPNKIESVGSYALKIWFDDGHSTGIYSFGMLRDLAAKSHRERA